MSKPVIIAPTRDRFVDWCQDNNIAPTQAVFVNSVHQLRGLGTDRVVWVGVPVHWSDRALVDAYESALMICRNGPDPKIDGPAWDDVERSVASIRAMWAEEQAARS